MYVRSLSTLFWADSLTTLQNVPLLGGKGGWGEGLAKPEGYLFKSRHQYGSVEGYAAPVSVPFPIPLWPGGCLPFTYREIRGRRNVVKWTKTRLSIGQTNIFSFFANALCRIYKKAKLKTYSDSIEGRSVFFCILFAYSRSAQAWSKKNCK